MRLLYIAIALSLTISAAVTPSDKDSSELRSIPINVKKTKRIKLSLVATGVRKISPRFSEESAFGRVRRLILADNNLVILDQFDNIMVFDMNGEFVRQIGMRYRRRGLGANIHDISFDDTEGLLYASTSDNGILCFDLNGNLQKVITGIQNPDALYFNHGQLFAFSPRYAEQIGSKFRNQTKMYIYSPKSEALDSVEVRSILLGRSIASFMTDYDYISNIDDRTYLYYPVLNYETIIRDTLYLYKDRELIPALKLDFNNFDFVYQSDPNNQYMSGTRNFSVRKIWRSSNYVFADYRYQKDTYFYLYDERNGRGINTKGGVDDNIFYCGTVEIRPLGNDMFYYTHQDEDTDEDRNVDIYIGKFK